MVIKPTTPNDLKRVIKLTVEGVFTHFDILFKKTSKKAFEIPGCQVEFVKSKVEALIPSYDAHYTGELGLLLNSGIPAVKVALAKSGIALDILIDDKNVDVLSAIASWRKHEFNKKHLRLTTDTDMMEYIDLTVEGIISWNQLLHGAASYEDFEIPDCDVEFKESLEFDMDYDAYYYGRMCDLLNSNITAVKVALAKNGYALDTLINDEDTRVRNAADWFLSNHVYDEDFDEYIRVKPTTPVDLKEVINLTVNNLNYTGELGLLLNSGIQKVESALVENGFAIEVIDDAQKEDASSAETSLEHEAIEPIVIKRTSPEDLKKVINITAECVLSYLELLHGVAFYKDFEIPGCRVEFTDSTNIDDVIDAHYTGELGLLLNSGIQDVKLALAANGFALDILINDEDKDVRREVAYYLECHMYDESLGKYVERETFLPYGYDMTNHVIV